MVISFPASWLGGLLGPGSSRSPTLLRVVSSWGSQIAAWGLSDCVLVGQWHATLYELDLLAPLDSLLGGPTRLPIDKYNVFCMSAMYSQKPL